MTTAREYMKPSGLSTEAVIKITASLLKGLKRTELSHIQQALLRKYFPYLPLRVIADMTGFKAHSEVTRNIRSVECNKHLNELYTEICGILDLKVTK